MTSTQVLDFDGQRRPSGWTNHRSGFSRPPAQPARQAHTQPQASVQQPRPQPRGQTHFLEPPQTVNKPLGQGQRQDQGQAPRQSQNEAAGSNQAHADAPAQAAQRSAAVVQLRGPGQKRGTRMEPETDLPAAKRAKPSAQARPCWKPCSVLVKCNQERKKPMQAIVMEASSKETACNLIVF